MGPSATWVHPAWNFHPASRGIDAYRRHHEVGHRHRARRQSSVYRPRAFPTGSDQPAGAIESWRAANGDQRSLLDTLHETVTRHRIDPQEVELEITESAVMGDIEYCVTLIERLRERGYRVSIDDFGTGHSSLAYLKKLPVNALKIDQAFIRGLTHDASGQKIVRTILDLARSLHLESVAEGVEDQKTLALLREWGCDYAQGFAVHRPSPHDQLVAWIERNSVTPAA